MNGYGELGLGATGWYDVVLVKVPGLTNVGTVRLGGHSSYAIRPDGTRWIWGFAVGPGRGSPSRNLTRRRDSTCPKAHDLSARAAASEQAVGALGIWLLVGA